MLLRVRSVSWKASARFRFRIRCFASAAEANIENGNSKDVAATPSKALLPSKVDVATKNRIVFSGIQPTGVPHLGNYLGALRQWKKFADSAPKLKGKHKLPINYFSVVDLHALTAPIAAAERFELQKRSFASLLAMGLVNSNSTAVFFQSEVRYHTDLFWVLSTIASTGYLSRMTQWKSKLDLEENVSLHSDEATAKLKLGLFSYPVLQAADILLYQATLVPVGEDQLQHIEFTRNLARGFHSHLAENGSKRKVFTIPEPYIAPAKRVMSLKKPTTKMSKSDQNPSSRILITDSPDEIKTKIKGALTDSAPGISYDPTTRPGISNLIEILKHTTNNPASCEEIAKDIENVSIGALKEKVAESITEELRGIGDTFVELMQPNNKRLHEEAGQGAHKARQKALQTYRNVTDALGLTASILDPKNQPRHSKQKNMPDVPKT